MRSEISTLQRFPIHYQQERERWPDLLRCIDRSCQGRATTDANDEVIAENNNHNHPPETAQATVAKVVDKVKERARNETVSVN